MHRFAVIITGASTFGGPRPGSPRIINRQRAMGVLCATGNVAPGGDATCQQHSCYTKGQSQMTFDLSPADTRVFLFHSPDAEDNPGAALDAVNSWLGKDRSASAYSNLRVRDITVTPDGKGGVYATIICTLGKLSSGNVKASRDQIVEEEQ